MARPRKDDSESLRVKRVIDAIRAGNTRRASAAAGPIVETTLYRWIREGRADPDSPAGAFVARLEEAEAEAERRMVGLWTAAAATDWRAARDYLARRYPANWSRDRYEQVDGDGIPWAAEGRIRAEMTRELVAMLNAWTAEHGHHEATADRS